jgi:antitoxin VapB
MVEFILPRWMVLNIKDAETHDLARQVAKRTGETLTRAVNVSLRQRLDRLDEEDQTKKRIAAILEIGRQGAKLFPGPNVDHAEFLYDENGLPK